MYRLTGVPRHYRWGSREAIHSVVGTEPDGRPLAEMWFGSHPSAPGDVVDETGAHSLADLIGADPAGVLGADVHARFGAQLPFLLKLIAPASPLSLQVHPSAERARIRFAAENAAGLPMNSPLRNYSDANHKPELVYALTPFEAVCGFRAPRRAAELLSGLDVPIARSLHLGLLDDPSPSGMRAAFTALLDPGMRPAPAVVADVARACARRLEEGSPSPRADGTVVMLQEAYPGDPGVVASLLLNPVSLKEGEALFVPAGGVHAYFSGLAVEIMAASDNVLRAGLTDKHIDVPEMLECVDYLAAPPVRIAPEVVHGTIRAYYAPVDDFELFICFVDPGEPSAALPGRGPRVVLCLGGEVWVRGATGELRLEGGQAAFVSAHDGPLELSGGGSVAQAGVP